MKRGMANGKPRPTRSSAKVEVSDAGMADRDISNLEQFKYSARGREQDATRGKDDETISTPHSKDNFDGKGKAVKSVPIKGKRGQVVRKTPAKEAKSDNGSSSTAAEAGEGGDEGVTKGTDAVSTSEDIDLWAVLQSQGSKGIVLPFALRALCAVSWTDTLHAATRHTRQLQCCCQGAPKRRKGAGIRTGDQDSCRHSSDPLT